MEQDGTAPRNEPAYRRHQWIGLIAGLAACVVMVMLPRPTDLSVEAWHTAAVGVLMAVWWMTEAIPIAATAMIPLVLLPILGIADIDAAAAPYANPLIFLFLGGFLIAAGMERWELHRRIALRIIDVMGPKPNAIIAGFAVAAAFLSMWVSNTATAMMMLPIGLSVVGLVYRERDGKGNHFATALMLTIAYSCSIGGMTTLIGTPPNAFFAGFMLESYGVSIAFAEWMQIGLPVTLIGLPAMYVVLTRVVYPVQIDEIPGGAAFIKSELAKLGSMARAERMVAGVFFGAAALWITRPLLDDLIPGLSDAGIAMTMGLVLFLLPADASKGVFLLEWDDAERLPWGVLILFGGGLSLAAAIDQTGLAAWLGSQTELIADWPLLLVILVITTAIVFLTELTSNIATAAAFLPIVASVGVGLGHSPMTLAVPAILAASSAFMLPVATPPNAIVYGSSFITIPKMARAGIVLNVVFILLISLLSYFLVPVVNLG